MGLFTYYVSRERGGGVSENWSFARKFPVVEQPKCGAKNIPRIFRCGQTSSGLPPVDSSFGSI